MSMAGFFNFGPEDLRFDFGAAEALATKLDNVATATDNERSSFMSQATTARTDFSGVFADKFSEHAGWADVDGLNLVTCLNELSRQVTALATSARDENIRRTTAREARREKFIELEQEQEESSGSLVLQPPTVAQVSALVPFTPGTPPSVSADNVSLKERDRSRSGSSMAGGTTSGRPDKLKEFRDAGAGLSAPGAGLQGAWDSFVAGLDGWGTVDHGGLIASVDKWHEANAETREWIGLIATELEKAGGGGGVGSVSDHDLALILAAAGAYPQREGLELELPQTYGQMPSTGYAADPVNTATGNFIEPEIDFSFQGAAELLAFTRMYNSQDEGVGSFGVGWSSVLDVRLELSDEGAHFVLEDGRHLIFPRNGKGWDRSVGANYWLQPENSGGNDSAGQLTVRDNTGRWWSFTNAGAWRATGLGTGNEVRVERDQEGRVALLRHLRGRSVSVEFTGDRVTGLVASDGRAISYTYDSSGRLIGVSAGAGTRLYDWNDDGLIARVISADGVVECENTYDECRRVVSQITPHGRDMRFVYHGGGLTSIKDSDGSNTNTWIADKKGRLIGVIDTDRRRQSMSYDGHGNLVSVTERDGQNTVHLYDHRGRRIRTVTPEGSDTSYEWDEHDRVTRSIQTTLEAGEQPECQAETVFEYGHETARQPYRVVDPLGGAFVLEWADGLLSAATDPIGVTTKFGYDAHGDLVTVTDAAGNCTRLARDEVGRVVEVVTPLGHRTQYSYDAAGNMTERVGPEGGVWQFEFGAGSRLVAQTDPCGAYTRFEYGTHGEVTQTIDPLGRVTEQVYDAFGSIRKTTLPDGTGWQFQYDGLSRLREVIDPDGGFWRADYDLVGEISATTDPTGVGVKIDRDRGKRVETVRSAFAETTVEFDPFGRPVGARRQDGGSEVTVYDLCGRVVEELDAEGGLTRYERDVTGRVTRTVSPAGRETVYEYDECGRPKARIDGLGQRTLLVYDSDSRVVELRLPNGDTATREYDPAGRVLIERMPGRGVARYGYDRAGRLTFSQDTQYGQRRFGYDAAGQLVKTVNGLGGVTHYEYDSLGRVVKIIDPAGGITTREYNGLNKVTEVTDPLGRRTEATYDGAGRQLTQTSPDGSTLSWEYDAGGQMCAYATNRGLIARFDTDHRTGVEMVEDHTAPGAVTVRHRIVRDRLGRIIERARDEQTTRWEYDPDGRRTHMATPGGDTVVYGYDLTGQLARVEHTVFGVIEYAYDSVGNLLSAQAGNTTQVWDYENGFPTSYLLTDDAGVQTTRILRDHEGRVVAIEAPSGATRYEHDEACQLVAALATDGTRRWRYDDAGRMTQETKDGETIIYRYDIGGQLIERSTSAGTQRYEYDQAGRRTRDHGLEGIREFEWDPRGYLTRISEDGKESQLWVDALGELAGVDGQSLFWDSAAIFPTLNEVGQTTTLAVPGVFGGPSGGLQPQGWRPSRNTQAMDPWTADFSTNAAPGGPGLALTVQGMPQIAGLEWMGARSYDPVSRGFLSVDPQEPAVGASWAGNPYSYAGNDPLHQLDPLGLSPLTDSDVKSTGNGFDLQNWSWITSVLTALGSPGAIYDSAVTTAKHAPGWLKSLIKFSRFIPWVGIPVTVAFFIEARVRGDVVDQWKYGVSFFLDIIPPLAPVGIVWDIGWTVAPPVVNWWNTDVKQLFDAINDPGTWFNWVNQLSYGAR